MTHTIKKISLLGLFVFLVFALCQAAPSSVLGEDVDLEGLTKKVYPSVVKVEAQNGMRRVASGVVIEKGGYIVTTALISPHDEEITVIAGDGKRIKAEFLGADGVTHLALIRAEEKSLPPVSMGKMEDLAPGSWICAVSISPENTPAVTQGIVSSMAQDSLRLNIWVVPGASGSPVVDREGKMVGLLRGVYAEEQPMVVRFGQKESRSLGYFYSRAEAPASGMAKAVPIVIVEKIATEIKETGEVQRGWLGVSIAENEEGRVFIFDVVEDSPASEGELEEEDIVLEFDGKSITSSEMLAHEIRMKKPGDSVPMVIEREGEKKKLKVKLGKYTRKDVMRDLELKFPDFFTPDKFPAFKMTPRGTGFFSYMQGFRRNYIGIQVQDLSPSLAEYFGVKKGTGVLINEVTKDGPAHKAGLKVGDVIIQVDGKRVENLVVLSARIQDKEKGDKVKITFIRDKQEKTVEVEVKAEKNSGAFRFFPGQVSLERFEGDARENNAEFLEKETSPLFQYGKIMRCNQKDRNRELDRYINILDESYMKKGDTRLLKMGFFHKTIKV
ncbi:MAG: PDZ domain-containing protein [Candidatus Aminicenantes bacterium]|nr:PDZ domain-containing protein [Candidatus Aminicenantes bacterium]